MKLPWDPEIERDAFERVRIRLERHELLARWSTFAKVRVPFSRSGGREIFSNLIGHCLGSLTLLQSLSIFFFVIR